jgi:hypothetical protein
VATHYGIKWTTKNNPVDNVSEILQRFPNAKDGFYWINFDNIGPQHVYCILNPSVNGGGWMSLNSIISPQIDKKYNMNSTWIRNRENRLIGKNYNILDVNVDERGCNDPSHYELQSPSVNGLMYTQTMLLIERVSTIGQCSTITGNSSNGWYDGPDYDGVFNSFGMCNWGNGIFSNACCDAQNMTDLKKYWVIFGSGNNHSLRYSVSCAGGSGKHFHMWFVK